MHQETDRSRLFRRRAVVLGAGQLAVMGALGGRLWQLQVDRGSDYALKAEDNRVNQRLLVPPRGRILDRNGAVLAANVPTYRVRVIREQAKDLGRILGLLGELVPLPPDIVATVLAEARRQRAFVPIPVRDDLSWDEVSRIAVRTPDLPGVVLDAGLVRAYPHAQSLAHVLGYTGAPSEADVEADPDPLLGLPDTRIGRSGIERQYDRSLRGQAGVSRFEVNVVGREIREIDRRDGEPGQDLTLGLDLRLQEFCNQRLATEIAAACVVIDVRSGALLALASVPTFDPRSFATGLSDAGWASLRDDPRKPLLDKCVRGQYPPGSTFKSITALAGLEAGVITPDTRIACTGKTWMGRAAFHCWKERGHGRLDLLQAIGQSCDCYFYEVARRTGIDRLAAMGRRFGLGEPVGIDLPGERPGLMPTSQWKKAATGETWQRGETLVCGIGQGFVLTTPLQLAVMTARMANGGRAVTPWLGRDPNAGEPPPIGIDPEHLGIVLRGMREVVHGGRGTARSAALGLPGIEIGGKTGTAQVRRITKAERAAGRHKRKDIPWIERDHALFVGFAPFAEPRYAVSVLIEHGISGSKAAAPVARDILRKTLELYPVPPPTATVAPPAASPA